MRRWLRSARGVLLRLWRSTSLRLALIFGAVFAIAALSFMLFIWWRTVNLLQEQVRVAIDADVLALTERWQEGGPSAVAVSIGDRVEQDVDDDTLYLLMDASGHPLAGNLTVWPTGFNDPSQWYQGRVHRAGTFAMAEIRVVGLPDGFRLLVGRDVRARDTLRHLLADTLFYAMLLVTALGLVGAVAVRGLFRRMIRNISRTTEAIASGRLDQRLPLSGTGDEFDNVSNTINHMLDRIAHLMDGVKQVSNAIAHDLRTPITRARTRLEDAALHAQGEGELRAAIERAVGELDDITAVFEALLRIAEIEAGSRRSAFAEIDLGPLLEDLGELYAAVAEDQGLELVLTVPQTLRVLGDRSLIQQAVSNLLDNAMKFSACASLGGVVTLSASREIRAGEGRDAFAARIVVTDCGIGMDEADLARATERFFRSERARSTRGSGLGLALVEAVAHLHGGTLMLENVHPGLRCTLTLRAEPEPRRLEGSLAAPSPPGASSPP